MKTVAVIPARVGSRRLPGKNLAEIGGKSLVRIAVECALDAGIDHIVVSTDSAAIWAAAINGGMLSIKDPQRIFHRERPPELASDDASSIAVVRDAVAFMAHWRPQVAFDATVLLQPTSPLRTPDDVIGCLRLLEESGGEAVVSVTDASEALRNDWLYALGHANRLREAAPSRGQYLPNGAVFLLSRKALEAGLDWWPPTLTYGYPMPVERSIDIDTAEDLERARSLARAAMEQVA